MDVRVEKSMDILGSGSLHVISSLEWQFFHGITSKENDEQTLTHERFRISSFDKTMLMK